MIGRLSLNSSTLMASAAERFITVFSSDGRLWQVEFAIKAVSQSDVTAVAVKSDNFVVVAVQKKLTDKLVDPTTFTHMFRITEHVGACLVGLLTDVLYISRRLRYSATNFQRKNGFEIPVSVLASSLSSIHQLESQYQSIRPTAVSAILFGYEPTSKQFALYRVDPAGLASGYRAVAAGGKETEVMSTLEKRTEPFATAQEASEFVLTTIRGITTGDLAAKDVEIAVLTTEAQRYRLLQVDEVEELLKATAGKD
jgi:20S proteasome subunit alpha 1